MNDEQHRWLKVHGGNRRRRSDAISMVASAPVADALAENDGTHTDENISRMRNRRCAFQAGSSAQESAGIAAIKSEGLLRSEAPRLFHTLTDVIGPRLSGSPGHVR
jgi:hypothetical protein